MIPFLIRRDGKFKAIVWGTDERDSIEQFCTYCDLSIKAFRMLGYTSDAQNPDKMGKIQDDLLKEIKSGR